MKKLFYALALLPLGATAQNIQSQNNDVVVVNTQNQGIQNQINTFSGNNLQVNVNDNNIGNPFNNDEDYTGDRGRGNKNNFMIQTVSQTQSKGSVGGGGSGVKKKHQSKNRSNYSASGHKLRKSMHKAFGKKKQRKMKTSKCARWH